MKNTVGKTSYTLLLRLVLGMQSVLLFLVFKKLLLAPNSRLFANSFDGLKNYFTYYTYLLPANTSLAKNDWLHYPFGDYIFYTDNTPLLAFPLKLISSYLVDLSPYSLAIYNLVIIGSILLSTWLLFLILTRFISNSWLLGLCSLLLPWIHPQIYRIYMHMNLSFSWTILLVIYLLIRLKENENAKQTVFLKSSGILILSCYLISFIHLYYSMILGFLIGGFCIFYAFANKSIPVVGRRFLISAILIPLTSILLVLSTVKMVDSYYGLRKSSATGFNWKNYNQYADAFYTSYEHLSIQFPLHATRDIHYESYSYLGAFSIFGCFCS